MYSSESRGATDAQTAITTNRCAICGHRTVPQRFVLSEPADEVEDPQSWVLCGRCYEAVLLEVRRAALPTSLRTRIAVGIVASTATTAFPPHIWERRYWRAQTDADWTRIIIGSIWIFIWGHMLAFIAILLLVYR